MLETDTLLQNRYHIRRLIGRGSMGAIYQAVDLRLDRDVAVKQIMRRGKQMQQAFTHEAQLLAQLRHPALPKVLDHFSDDAGDFLVMEYISGEDLAAAALKRLEPFSPRQLIAWAKQLLHLLIYLHGRQPPVLHGDIKPANLKQNETGEIVLLDFGLAHGQPVGTTADTNITGYTRHYAAPEQIQGGPTDARSDLYALAATLYDLATGVKPPDAVKQRLTAVSAGQPDPLPPAHVVAPLVPTAVSTVLQTALALNPADRYASARDMLLTLETAVAQQKAVPHNLPAQVTPFVGRRQEVAAIRRQFLDEGARLITLTGPGGIGKTRLALESASILRDAFPDGVFFVPLAALRDPALVVSAVARTLDVKESGRRPLQTAVQDVLQDKQTLLLLDNFEHLPDAALLVADLLAACPYLRVLVTSRSALRLRGEHRFPVPPLSLPAQEEAPDATKALQYKAVRLFVQQAQAANPAFVLHEGNVTAVVQICRRLDGLPLAIELAAAHADSLTPTQIVDRLTERFDLLRGGPRDLPPRQQALQATLDWSHNLLHAAEKQLFRQLAVFAGGFTLEAAKAVCCSVDADHTGFSIAGGLTALVGKSLLQQAQGTEDTPRYTMFVTIQAYAATKLAQSGEADRLRQQHADYYLALALEAKPNLTGAAPEEWFDRLEIEHDNLRAGLRWLIAQESTALALMFSEALWRFWQARGYFTEGRRWLEKALATKGEASLATRSAAYSAAGNLALEQGDYQSAFALHRQDLALRRQINDEKGLSIVLNNLAIVALDQCQFDQAEAWLLEAKALSMKVGYAHVTAHALNNLGLMALRRGEYTKAITYLTESLAHFRDMQDKRAMTIPLNNLGEAYQYRKQYEQAAEYLHKSVQLLREIGDQGRLSEPLGNLGYIAMMQEDYEQADSLLRESLHLAKEAGYRLFTTRTLQKLGQLAYRLGQFAEAQMYLMEALNLQQEISDRGGTAVSLYQMGLILNARGQQARAVQLFAASDALVQRLGTPLPPAAQTKCKMELAAARAALGADAFDTAWANGQALPPDEAIILALK